ncbi:MULTISPECIES: amidohydrolase [Chromobacterium]|uniref:amidohydrolase n=1 Tax=Chromobacterium TaxID=535 RepID=UPI00188876BF|nr:MULTISPECIES: amidohydrolase [Chromobacterium]QOZ83952.1 amidohydrolase [Chromobacterium sp. Rain0013]WON84099.1 amidohydrolase [Chromobacterium haemolyticum]
MPNQDLAVTLVQSDIAWESVDQNLQRMERHLSAVNDSQLIVLPEMFTTGFSMRPEKIAETMDGKAVQWLRDTARAKRADLVGSVAIQDQGRYYNRLLWAKADGSLFSYDKKHLFSFAGEHEHYTPGDAPLIVKVDGWSVAAFVCYDLRFPVWSRNNKSQYDLALYIASWPERRARHWQTLLPARAIENQAFVIGVNRVGVDGNDIRYSGDSMLIDPLGDTLYHGRQLESVYQAKLSRAQLDDVRAQFPFLKDADRYQLV